MQIITAQVNNSYNFGSHHSTEHTILSSIKAGDFMMYPCSDVKSPIIFLNNKLPEILLCISRELAILQREQSLCGKSPALDTQIKTEPLAGWYKSILGNTYSIGPGALEKRQPAKQYFASFTLLGDVYQPMKSYFRQPSQFNYVTLALPPLWQKQRPSLCANISKAAFSDSADYTSQNKHCFSFSYCSGTGFWFVSESKVSVRKLIPNELFLTWCSD